MTVMMLLLEYYKSIIEALGLYGIVEQSAIEWGCVGQRLREIRRRDNKGEKDKEEGVSVWWPCDLCVDDRTVDMSFPALSVFSLPVINKQYDT